MEYTDFIRWALQAMLIVTVPILCAFLCHLIHKAAAKLEESANTEWQRKILREVESGITTAVAMVNQTYVDELKKEDRFTQESQKEALQKAYSAAVTILSEETLDFIQNVYGDLENYLTAHIEEQVHNAKNGSIALGAFDW